MKSIFHLRTAVAASLLFCGFAHSELSPVIDAKEKAAIEGHWIRNKSLKLTDHNPDLETIKRAQAIIEEKKIKEKDISEALYYSIDDGRHVIFVETDKHDGQARYHCIGFTKDRVPAVYWVQLQKRGEEIQIETIEKPTQPKAEAAPGQPAATNSVVSIWKVNWEKAPVIESIPDRYKFRFKTLEDYRKYVIQRATGLVLDIQANQTAVLRYGDGKSESYRWKISPQAPEYDIWLQTKPHLLSYVTIGHGFKVSGANTATLLFQLEWDEDAATRVQLAMERQQPDPTKPK